MAGDGSAPFIGEMPTVGGGTRQRTPRRGERVADITTDPTRSRDMDAHNAAVRAAHAAHNDGSCDSGGPVLGLDG